MIQEKAFSQLTSIDQFAKEDFFHFFAKALEVKKEKTSSGLEGKILASCFFEPSTRTRLSFESAMLRLGGSVIGFSDEKVTSGKKGESLQDTIKTVSLYADIIVLRHPLDGASTLAAASTTTPVINAGDGTGEHPTQTLTDLFTLYETRSSLEDLHIGIVGDLFYGRTCHSLAIALSHFQARLYFVAPSGLQMPTSICDLLKKRGIKFSFHETMEEVAPKWDVLYMTRLQKERGAQLNEHPYFLLKKSDLTHMKPSVSILHPFPRAGELDLALDASRQALYFQQMDNGLVVRKTLLLSMLEDRS
ncbi:MAG: aspartate carbamoyltransferase [Chlamydiota bacterium]